MAVPEEAILLFKWLVACLVGGYLALISISALLERDIEPWQGLLGITTAMALTALAISLARTAWYVPLLVLIILLVVAAYLLNLLDLRIRAQRMLEEDEARYREAIEFDYKNAAAHAFLARVYRKQRRLEQALSEYERALELDTRDEQARREMRGLMEQTREGEAPRVCPRCQAPLDAAGKTCAQCGWSRSTLRGLRDLWAGGALKYGLIYGILASVALAMLGAVLRLSLQFTLTLLLVLWMVGGVLYFWWLLRDLF